MHVTQTQSPTKSFKIIAWVALAWNALGVVTYLLTVTMGPEALEALPEAERALYENTPTWATGAYAIAVFGGTLAALALLLRKAWAVPVFIVSLVAILVQMGQALFMTPVLSVRGAGAAFMPMLIIAVAVYLVWYSRKAKEHGWLR